MENNKGYTVFNSYLKGFLDKDDRFSSNLAIAKIFDNETQCKTEIAKVSKQYKEVEAYHENNMEIKKVSISIVE